MNAKVNFDPFLAIMKVHTVQKSAHSSPYENDIMPYKIQTQNFTTAQVSE